MTDDFQNCPDFIFKNPHPKYRCKKGHYCSPGICVTCINMIDEAKESGKVGESEAGS